MIPRKLAALGLVGAVLVFLVGNLKMLDFLPQFSIIAIVLVLPVALYEMILAGWFIVKGFNFD